MSIVLTYMSESYIQKIIIESCLSEVICGQDNSINLNID